MQRPAKRPQVNKEMRIRTNVVTSHLPERKAWNSTTGQNNSRIWVSATTSCPGSRNHTTLLAPSGFRSCCLIATYIETLVSALVDIDSVSFVRTNFSGSLPNIIEFASVRPDDSRAQVIYLLANVSTLDSMFNGGGLQSRRPILLPWLRLGVTGRKWLAVGVHDGRLYYESSL